MPLPEPSRLTLPTGAGASPDLRSIERAINLLPLFQESKWEKLPASSSIISLDTGDDTILWDFYWAKTLPWTSIAVTCHTGITWDAASGDSITLTVNALISNPSNDTPIRTIPVGARTILGGAGNQPLAFTTNDLASYPSRLLAGQYRVRFAVTPSDLVGGPGTLVIPGSDSATLTIAESIQTSPVTVA